MSAAAQKI